MIKNKKAAMEMSVGTLVTIVLLMVVLVLGVVLIRSIFSGSQDAVEQINSQVIDEINKVFEQEGSKISVAPSSRSISLDRTKEPAGFAFSVINRETDNLRFSYIVRAVSVDKCGTNLKNPTDADKFLMVDHGNFPLRAGFKLDLPILIKFDIPETAPPCTMIFQVNVCRDMEECPIGEVTKSYTSIPQIYVTIK